MRTPCIVAILLAAITTHAVSAQQLDPSMCDQLAKLPNPPMSVEACKSMFGLATMLDRMADDPRGIRPGDDAMSCAAIFDDMKTMTDGGLSTATTARMDGVAEQGQAAAVRGAAEMTGFMVETAAVGIAIVAMGPYVPNFVGAAIVAAWQARAVAFATGQQAEAGKLTAQMRPAIEDAAAELAQSMKADPRFARLGYLATREECEAPAAPK